jgi:hypothetical protein
MDLTTLLLITMIGTAIYTICFFGGLALLRRHDAQCARDLAEKHRRTKIETAQVPEPTTTSPEHNNLDTVTPNGNKRKLAWGDS